MYCKGLCLFGAIYASLLAGCGSSEFQEPPKADVEGTVLIDDMPLPEGLIIFEEGAKGLSDSIPIRDGKFLGKVSLGDKKVMITATKPGPPNEMYPDQPTTVNYIPAKYNQDSELKASIAAGGATGMEFKVSSM